MGILGTPSFTVIGFTMKVQLRDWVLISVPDVCLFICDLVCNDTRTLPSWRPGWNSQLECSGCNRITCRTLQELESHRKGTEIHSLGGKKNCPEMSFKDEKTTGFMRNISTLNIVCGKLSLRYCWPNFCFFKLFIINLAHPTQTPFFLNHF